LYSGEKPLVHLTERTERTERQAAVGAGYLDHVAFRASGLASRKNRLASAGVEYRSGFIAEFNMTQLFFKDPAGTGLEVNFPDEH
jgi:catechol-2,3-dioxygenase